MITSCKNCTNFFKRAIDSSVCNDCNKQYNKDFEILREYLRLHPRASIIDIVSDTYISLSTINKFIEEQKVVVKAQ